MAVPELLPARAYSPLAEMGRESPLSVKKPGSSTEKQRRQEQKVLEARGLLIVPREGFSERGLLSEQRPERTTGQSP